MQRYELKKKEVGGAFENKWLGYQHLASEILRVSNPVANLIKHLRIVIYDSRVVLTTKLPILHP